MADTSMTITCYYNIADKDESTRNLDMSINKWIVEVYDTTRREVV